MTFDVPEHLEDRYRGHAGQHLVLRLTIDGADVRRPYSLSSSPETGASPTITVKETPDGYASRFLNRRLAAGAVIEVEPPDGHFVLDHDRHTYRTYYLFAAGSGVTPIMSHLRTILATQPNSTVYMAYGNRNPESTIFRDQLESLSADPRLTLTHFWSEGSDPSSMAAVESGRLDAERIADFVERHRPVAQDCKYLVCGPDGFMDVVETGLKQLGVPEADILVERFTPPPPNASTRVLDESQVTIHNGGLTTTAVATKAKSMLRALNEQGADIPFACESGVCGTCVAEIVGGEVHMPVTFGLTRDQLSNKGVLVCQAQPLTPTVELDLS